jgi:hypothetical protein
VRKLEESEHLARKMEGQARSRGNERSAQYYADMAQGSASHAETLRDLLTQHPAPAEQPLAVERERTSSPLRG